MRIPQKRHLPIPVILDTDLQEDVDDLGALAVLHHLASDLWVELLGITHCTSAPWGVPAIGAVNEFYGRPDIPVGTLNGREGFLADTAELSYARFIARAYPTRLHQDSAPEAVVLLRSLLAKREQPDVTVIGIGPMPNLAGLLASAPDEISPLHGLDLMRHSVNRIVLMAGAFPRGREYNVVSDPAAARTLLDNWPGEILFCGSEVGTEIRTGGALCADEYVYNPVASGYFAFSNGRSTASFDQSAVLAAVRPRRYFRLSRPGVVSVSPDGSSAFQPQPGGRHRHVILRRPDRLRRDIERLMQPPRALQLPTETMDNRALWYEKMRLLSELSSDPDEQLDELEQTPLGDSGADSDPDPDAARNPGNGGPG